VRRALEEIVATVRALAAYLFTVLPAVRRELRRWEPLPEEKAKNAEAVAVYAILAPRSHRSAVVRAIVALQVAIDYRDVAEETGAEPDPARLAELTEVWTREAATLPSYEAIAEQLSHAVERCEKAQRLTHNAARGHDEALRRLADDLSVGSDYRWWEIAAAASSSVSAHALVAAAANPSLLPEMATLIDAAYFPSIGALTVILDDLVDLEADRAAGEHSYLGYYDDADETAKRLAEIARRAETLVTPLPQAIRHRAILDGVLAFYLGAPANSTEAEATRLRLMPNLRPGARLLSTFVRVRRKVGRERLRPAGNPPEPLA